MKTTTVRFSDIPAAKNPKAEAAKKTAFHEYILRKNVISITLIGSQRNQTFIFWHQENPDMPKNEIYRIGLKHAGYFTPVSGANFDKLTAELRKIDIPTEPDTNENDKATPDAAESMKQYFESLRNAVNESS